MIVHCLFFWCFKVEREDKQNGSTIRSLSSSPSLAAVLSFPLFQGPPHPHVHLRLDGQVVPRVGGGVAVRLSHGESRGKGKKKKRKPREGEQKSERRGGEPFFFFSVDSSHTHNAKAEGAKEKKNEKGRGKDLRSFPCFVPSVFRSDGSHQQQQPLLHRHGTSKSGKGRFSFVERSLSGLW